MDKAGSYGIQVGVVCPPYGKGPTPTARACILLDLSAAARVGPSPLLVPLLTVHACFVLTLTVTFVVLPAPPHGLVPFPRRPALHPRPGRGRLLHHEHYGMLLQRDGVSPPRLHVHRGAACRRWGALGKALGRPRPLIDEGDAHDRDGSATAAGRVGTPWPPQRRRPRAVEPRAPPPQRRSPHHGVRRPARRRASVAARGRRSRAAAGSGARARGCRRRCGARRWGGRRRRCSGNRARGGLRGETRARPSSAAAARARLRSVGGIGLGEGPRRRVARSARGMPLRVGSGGAGEAAKSPSSGAPPCRWQREWLAACRWGAGRGAAPERPPCTPGRRRAGPPRPRPQADMGALAVGSTEPARRRQPPRRSASAPPLWSPLRACGRPRAPPRRRQVDCGRETEAPRAPCRNRIRHV